MSLCRIQVLSLHPFESPYNLDDGPSRLDTSIFEMIHGLISPELTYQPFPIEYLVSDANTYEQSLSTDEAYETYTLPGPPTRAPEAAVEALPVQSTSAPEDIVEDRRGSPPAHLKLCPLPHPKTPTRAPSSVQAQTKIIEAGTKFNSLINC